MTDHLPANDGRGIKILSFNIWGLPFWPINSKSRVVSIINYLKEIDADIVCIQESFDTRHRDLIFKELAIQGYHIAEDEIKVGMVGDSVLRKKRMVPFVHLDATGGLVIFSKFPIVSSKFFPFEGWNYSFLEWLGRKGVLEIMVTTPAGPLRVINTHLCAGHGPLAAKVRVRQMNFVATFPKKEDNIPIIMAGDFNQDNIVEHENFAVLSEKKFVHPELFDAGGQLPSYRKENPYVNNMLNRNDRSMRYDYIFTKNIDRYGLVVRSYVPIPIEPALSDHDPVLMELIKI